MQKALEQGFQQATGHRVRFSFGSSGTLARQIENGAPFDVYLSANETYVKDLASHGDLDVSSIVVYALGRIAIWSADGSIKNLSDLGKVRHLAIPNPVHAPYGVAARQALEHQGLWKSVERRIVYGENVRQALQFAESRNADAVITSWTLLQNRGALIPSEWHAPIRQAGAVTSSTKQAAAARSFLEFLGGPEGRKILSAGGLTIP